MTISLIALPAILSLIAKAVIFVYARHSRVRNLETQLALLFLFTLSVMNMAEILALTGTSPHGAWHGLVGENDVWVLIVYFMAATAAIGVLAHTSLELCLMLSRSRWASAVKTIIYGYAAAVIVLLLGTDLVVSGFETDTVAYSYHRVPGPLYVVFELYAIGSLVMVLGLLTATTFRRGASRMKRLRTSWILIGLAPLLLMVIFIVIGQRLGLSRFNSLAVLPVTMTFLVFCIVYATHHHRLLDIRFFVPWSRIRHRKTGFHRSIRQLINELSSLPSVEEAVKQVGTVLGCPIALLRPAAAAVSWGDENDWPGSLSAGDLRQEFSDITVADEIQTARPGQLHFMSAHNIGAVVPFGTAGEPTLGWLVIGRRFGEAVYTSADFELVEELFGRMADLFLDSSLALRGELERKGEEVESLSQEILELRARLDAAELERSTSTDVVARPIPVTIMGRDRALQDTLGRHFPYVRSLTGPTPPHWPCGVLICRVDNASEKLARRLAKLEGVTFLLHGTGSAELVERFGQKIPGAFVSLGENASIEDIVSAARQIWSDLQPEGAIDMENAEALDEQLSRYEAHLIRRALDACGGNRSQAARMLRVKSNTLHYKIKRHGLLGKD